jgi:hypothetical protein
VIVRVTGTVVLDEVNVTVLGLKLQLVFGGREEHVDGKSAAEPTRPFCATKVSVVDADCPGLAMLRVDGEAVIAKVPPISIGVATEVEPA